MKRLFAHIAIAALAFSFATAAPLDDRIAAFKTAPTQTESAVSAILDLGLSEKRSALAFASVKPWLAANASEAPQFLFLAAQSAEFAGEWRQAVSFYRKLLTLKDLDAAKVAIAAPACYRLLINHLGDTESAYLFMREEGIRFRASGEVRKFDAWFLGKAAERKDLVATANLLTAIYQSDEPREVYEAYLTDLLADFETFTYKQPQLFNELKGLAVAKHATPITKARLQWAIAIIPCIDKMTEALNAKRPVTDTLMDEPLQAARELIAAAPYEGSIIVAKGWMHFNAGDSGVFSTFVNPRRADKAAPLIAALKTLPVEQARAILSLQVAAARGRQIIPYLISHAEVRSLITARPEIFNSLAAPDVPILEPSITPAEAKTIAPHLARNPHPDAALIRALAENIRSYSAAVDYIVKADFWRFASVKDLANLVWNTPNFEHGQDKLEASISKHANLDSTFQNLKKQTAATASEADRKNAFNALLKDLLGTPTIPSALYLWGELFGNAPETQASSMLLDILAEIEPERENLLIRAGMKSRLGGHTLYWQANLGDNFMSNGPQRAAYSKATAPLVTKIQPILLNQAKSDRINSTLFAIWMHAANPQDPAVIETIKSLAASPVFATLPTAHRLTAVDAEHFATAALPAHIVATSSKFMSRELLSLPANADPAAVEAAFKTVIERATKSPIAVTVLGLGPVAKLPEWSDPLRKSIHSLFSELAPIGSYPKANGYQQLALRVINDAAATNRLGDLQSIAPSLWAAATATDDARAYPAADAFAKLAAKFLTDKNPSIAATLGRSASQSIASLNPAQGSFTDIIASLRKTSGLAAAEIGAAEIPVDATDPAYPIYKSNAEFAAGNLDSAWQLYLANANQLAAVLRALPVNYAFWLLEKSIETDRSVEAENLIKELTIWSRQVQGTFSPSQDAQLKIAYADLAFRKGALPTARAWYRKVAEAAEYEGSEVHLTAALGSVNVDRVSKNYGAAMTELDNLMKFPNADFRKKIRYARAEVLMDQENYAEALVEIEQVLRQEPKHPDALILRGKIHFEMRKLVEASEIELGPSQDKTVIVPGETVKINLRDPTLNVSGVGTDIEVEIWAKSGDRERVLLYQLGDSKEKFRAEVATALGAPVPGDKILQILGEDEIRFGYSERFRAKMKDLPADPDMSIGVASDAFLSFSAGAFPAREGERRLNIEELGISSAQAALGTRTVRPGNPVYIRVTDPDRSITSGIDEVIVGLQTSSGDEIRQLTLKETSPFSGEFQGIVPTAGAQAIAFASESAPGRDPNMAISSREYPGWQGNVGDKDKPRTFGIDLNDNAAINKMNLDMGDDSSRLKNFVLQTSLDGRNWTTRARYPETTPVWDGKPLVSSFRTYSGGSVAVSEPESRELPADWLEKMELNSNSSTIEYLSANVKSLSAAELPIVNTGHPGYSGLIRYRAMFHQPAAAIRRFQLTGYPDDGNTIFLLNGTPAPADAVSGLLIERELTPGLHEIQIWRNAGRETLSKSKPVLLCDQSGKPELVPCSDTMFDPLAFPENVRAAVPQVAKISSAPNGRMDIEFGDQTRARLVRLVINGFDGVVPTIRKVTLTNREGKGLIPVAKDFMELRQNDQLEVLPGDNISVRYQDPRTASPKRDRHEQRLSVAFNDATLTASFLNYIETEEGRELVLEPIRRFRFDDAVAIVIDDPDMDASTEKDMIEIQVTSSSGGKAKIQAIETEEHSGRFLGRIFPVTGQPARASEIQITEGGTLTAIYLDSENLSPGIPTEREVIIQHAKYSDPALSAYTASTQPITTVPEKPAQKKTNTPARTTGPEVVTARRSLHFEHSEASSALNAVIGSSVRFDVVFPHLALAGSSTVNAYVQTEAGRKAIQAALKEPFDVAVPGTLKLTGSLKSSTVVVPDGYHLAQPPTAPGNQPPLEEGRFSFTIPLILGETPDRSFATKSAESLPESSLPDGLAVKTGDIVHVGYPYKDTSDQIKWITASFRVESHPFLDVMNANFTEPLTKAFIGEKIYLRLIDRGLDRGPARDTASVTLKAGTTTTTYELQETEAHSGIFKSAFAISYAADKLPAKLPPIALNGLPVRYGDNVEISYKSNSESQSHSVIVNNGADGFIEPFSKRFSGDEMAVRTSFTLAECYFELAKKHRELEQESLARREIAQARKLLAEAIATHRDDDLRAHAEYLLGNLSQEYADLAKNEESKLPMYQDALARFSKIPADYPDTEFAPKAQFKTALVYEKMGETENAVEEYVKLAYKYPNHELIPSVMSRLGAYFQQTGLAFKQQADPLRQKTDDATKSEVLRLDQLSYPEFLNAAMVFAKLQERFPEDPLAGLAGLRAGQNYMRAHQYNKAVKIFTSVHANEKYDDREIRSQSLYWSGICQERLTGLMSEDNGKGRGQAMEIAYETYRRVTFDFPDSIWAKYSRGRLADPAFETRVKLENEARERMIKGIKESRKKR